MRVEFVFFIGFIIMLAIGFAMQPYFVEKKDASKLVEVEFDNFLLTQTDTKGFKAVIKGDVAQKYRNLLIIHKPYAYDKDGATVKGKNAKLIQNDLYIDEDVIITTPDGARLFSQAVLYNTKTQIFETLQPFVAYYNEHKVEGDKLWYQEGVVKSTNVKANIKQDNE